MQEPHKEGKLQHRYLRWIRKEEASDQSPLDLERTIV